MEESDAKLRFVFLHHLVGGSDRNQRGGKEAAPFWKWGGKGASGEDDFDQQRPGWGKPIHQVLVDQGVNIVFHGHDHMFIKQALDGIIYQLVPQPGHPRSGKTSAEEYGCISGEVQGSSGHVRVRSGVKDPDFPDTPIGGWAGKIIKVEAGNPPCYLIRWNQQTLASIHPVYRNRCERGGLDFEEMQLGEDDLEPDSGGEVIFEHPTKIVPHPCQ